MAGVEAVFFSVFSVFSVRSVPKIFAVTKLLNNFHFSKFRMAETGEKPP